MSSIAASRGGRPTVTVFTSIAGICRRLREADPHLPLVEICDDCLTGFGGTVHFDASQLSSHTVEQLRAAEILIAEPAVLAPLLMLQQDEEQEQDLFPNLHWVQSTYAGVDPLLKLDKTLLSNFTLTRFAGKFGPPIAEWCLARMIGHERNFAATAADQRDRAWCQSKDAVTEYRYMSDLTLTVLGCGNIGQCIARAAKAFGMRCVGYVRTERTNSDNDDITKDASVDVYTTSLSDALSEADYIVSVLPSTPDTVGLLSGDALSICQAKAPVFLNVGRGSIIDEASLLSVLDSKFISAAILDVFETEPLPLESQLWDHPNVTVSPHVSGLTRGADVPDIFLKNYRRYCNRQELLYAVDWKKGY